MRYNTTSHKTFVLSLLVGVILSQTLSANALENTDTALSNSAPNTQRAVSSVTRGPYLQMASSSSMTIRWRTSTATDSEVRAGTSANNLSKIERSSTQTTEHEIRLTDLTPNTTYYYSIGSSSSVLGSGTSYFFKTPPTTGSRNPTRIWVIGDSGTANSDAEAVYDAYRTLTGTAYTDLWLMLGDNAYNTGTDTEYQQAVFDLYPELLKQTVVWPTIGNHDGTTADSESESGPYYDIFTLPRQAESGGLASGTEAYYAFDYGNVHFVVLDSYETDRSETGAMMQWLRSDLQNTNADWIIAFWHHPPYSKGSHDSDSDDRMTDMRSIALPILEGYGVDLVLTGHSHAYERSKFLDGHYQTSDTFSNSYEIDNGSGRTDGTGAYKKKMGAPHSGAVYVVAGSSGQVSSSGNLDHPAMYLSLRELGSMILDVNGLTLNASFIDDTGTKRDYFTLSKENTVDTTPDAFRFVDQQNIALSKTIRSNTITVTGINSATPISVKGGKYNINGGAFTNVKGTVKLGDKVTLQHTTPATYNTTLNTILTIGGVADTFSSTTMSNSIDTQPDAFRFVDQQNVALSKTIRSNTITVTGINSAAPISVKGGKYNINGGAFTNVSGTVKLGDKVILQHTTPATYNTTLNTTLTIGGIADTFSSTTLADTVESPEFIKKGAIWKYLDNGSNQGTAWRSTAFNHGAWKSGAAQLGYGDNDENTVVSYGNDSSMKYITTYFRYQFNVKDPSRYQNLSLNLLRDDGAVIYLNGVEILRDNMPEGSISYQTLASSTIGDEAEEGYTSYTLPRSALVSGTNTIAVEVHQSSEDSSDISFDLAVTGH